MIECQGAAETKRSRARGLKKLRSLRQKECGAFNIAGKPIRCPRKDLIMSGKRPRLVHRNILVFMKKGVSRRGYAEHKSHDNHS